MAAATSQSRSAPLSAQEDGAILAQLFPSQQAADGEHAQQTLQLWKDMSAGDRVVCVFSVLAGASAGVAVLAQVEWDVFLRVVHKLGYHKGKIKAGSRATDLHRLFHWLNSCNGVAAMKNHFPLDAHAWLQHFGNDGVYEAMQRAWPGLDRGAVALAISIIVAALTYKALQSIRHSRWFRALQTRLPELFRAIRTWVYAKSQAWRSMRQQETSKPAPSSPSVSMGYAVAGTGAVVGGTAAPAAAVSVVTAAGFGSGGVVGGSLAAGAMSASGGAVASGSAVATCQSIGATGSLLAGAGVGVTVGVVIGGALAVAATTYGAYRLYTHIRSRGGAATAAAPAAPESTSDKGMTILDNLPPRHQAQASRIHGAMDVDKLSLEELGWDAELELPEVVDDLVTFNFSALMEEIHQLSIWLHKAESPSAQMLISSHDFTSGRLLSHKVIPPLDGHRCRL
jgi:hypothetical protein